MVFEIVFTLGTLHILRNHFFGDGGVGGGGGGGLTKCFQNY